MYQFTDVSGKEKYLFLNVFFSLKLWLNFAILKPFKVKIGRSDKITLYFRCESYSKTSKRHELLTRHEAEFLMHTKSTKPYHMKATTQKNTDSTYE